MGILTDEDIKQLFRESKKYLDQLRDYDLGKWKPKHPQNKDKSK